MKKEYLIEEIKHINIKEHNITSFVEAMKDMSFQARNLYNAANIYKTMLLEKKCGIILTLSGSLFSSGLKEVVIDMINHNMIDVIVSTGANIVDQDFFEALGFKHYKGTQYISDEELRVNHIDRIYDTFIDEDDLRICDDTIKKIADELGSGVLSSREFIKSMGKYITETNSNIPSVVKAAYQKNVPIFVPAFSDCSAGFGLVAHQWNSKLNHISIDSVKDFKELVDIKIKCGTTGLFMVGGGVPKNFVQDTVVAVESLGFPAEMHKYAIQVTVADERDGGLSGSTLKEAHSWGKVNMNSEQMVFCEATIAVPLIVGYAYHSKAYLDRNSKEFSLMFDESN